MQLKQEAEEVVAVEIKFWINPPQFGNSLSNILKEKKVLIIL